MVALNTVLIVGTLTFGSGVLVTVLIGLLIAIYRNTKKKDDEDESGIYTIPASALMRGPVGGLGGGPGGGMDGLMQLYHAAQTANAAEKAEEGKKDKDEKTPGGNYL